MRLTLVLLALAVLALGLGSLGLFGIVRRQQRQIDRILRVLDDDERRRN